MKRTHKTILIVNTLLLAISNIYSAFNSIILRCENEKLRESINTLEERYYAVEQDYIECKWTLEEINEMRYREE